MWRWLPDWLLYTAIFLAIVFILFQVEEEGDAPPAPPPPILEDSIGPLLPGPSAFDPAVIVDIGPASGGVGSAFAIDADGWWLTARHVVDACDQVGIVIARTRAVAVNEVRVARFADLALLKTDRAPSPLQLANEETAFRVGQPAFHFGFPQGKPGEAASRLLGRERLIARGRYQLNEPVMAWAEVGRTEDLFGSLSGMSGGPVFDAQGRVIGVTVAEASRRGRIYSAAPSSIAQLLALNDIAPRGAPTEALTLTSYGEEADRLRRELAVAQVICVAR